ncbi:MAG TPA: NUDIX hydrolase [Acidimicrobiia bacterium]|nr:NUDIX hydrolase [Acidimicrobiia bacterium]
MPAVVPRAAATVLLVVDRPLEVLMVRRTPGGMFGGAWVFPGGVVDQGDGLVAESDSDGDSLRAAAVRELVEETGVVIAGHDLRFVSRWITPEGLPRRYDTRFFLGVVGKAPDLEAHALEVADAAFIAPVTALAAHQAHQWRMVLPTIAHLRWLARYESGSAALRATEEARTAPISPQLRPDGSVVEVDLPW